MESDVQALSRLCYRSTPRRKTKIIMSKIGFNEALEKLTTLLFDHLESLPPEERDRRLAAFKARSLREKINGQ